MHANKRKLNKNNVFVFIHMHWRDVHECANAANARTTHLRTIALISIAAA